MLDIKGKTYDCDYYCAPIGDNSDFPQGVINMDLAASFKTEECFTDKNDILDICRLEALYELVDAIGSVECDDGEPVEEEEDEFDDDFSLEHGSHFDRDWFPESGAFGERDSLHTRRSVRMLLDGTDLKASPSKVHGEDSSFMKDFLHEEAEETSHDCESYVSASFDDGLESSPDEEDESDKAVAPLILPPLPGLPMHCPSPDARAA